MQIDTTIKLKIQALLPYLIFALIIFVIKLIIIANYGNATPFWDQWDAEATLYSKLIEGNLTWNDLFAAHNEHRIFTTRIFVIISFLLNGGIWNPIWQMQLNALIHVLALVTFLLYISKFLNSIQRHVLLIFSTVLFAIPFGWENTLHGFNVQHYFFLLFSSIYLWAMAHHKIYTNHWWLGIIAGILSFLSLALGIITILAGVLILSLRHFLIKEEIVTTVSALGILIAIAIVAIILTPIIPRHSVLRANSIAQFLFIFANLWAWPAPVAIGVLVIQTPILILSFYVLKDKFYQTSLQLFLIAIALWLFGIFAITAYGRAQGFDAPRYTDAFAIGLVINFVALIILFNNAQYQTKLYFSALFGVWVATVVLGFVCAAERITQGLKDRLVTSLAQEKNVHAYLCTGEFSYLENKPLFHIPYPDPKQLKSRLDNPNIRKLLPGNIYGPNANNCLDPTGKLFCKQYASPCIGSIDRINGNTPSKQFLIADKLDVRGWLAYSSQQSSLPYPIVVLTNKKGKKMFFDTQKMDRQDIATRFNNTVLNSSGFIAIINVPFMFSDYTLGLGFLDGKDVKLCPQFKIRGTIVKE